MITVEELAFALIAVLEGLRLAAYQDSGGVWTIGIGHTGPDVHAGMTITEAIALELFQKDAAPLLARVAGIPLVEAAALVSFGYNVGIGALELVLAGHDTIANPKHYTDRHGNVLSGLMSRRRLEELLCVVSQEQSAQTLSPSS